MTRSTRDNERVPPAGGEVIEMPAGVSKAGDAVGEILRSGAQALLAQALAAEIAACLATFETLRDG